MIKHPNRDTFLSKHHIVNKIKGGKTKPRNIIMLWRDKHTVFHIIFQSYSLKEILNKWNSFDKYFETHLWKLVFNNNDPDYCKDVIKRIIRIKRKQPKHY